MKQVNTSNQPFLEPSLLFDVFEDLRRQGVTLGLEEYLVLNRVVETGKGLESYADFKRLCQLVWATSYDDLALIDQAFARIVDPWLLAPLPKEQGENRGKRQTEDDHQKVHPQRQEDSKPLKDSPLGGTSGTQEAKQPLKAFHLNILRGKRVTGEGLRSTHHFVMRPRWPVSVRTMATTWSSVRQPRRQSAVVEWDVQGTIDRTAQAGMFTGPVFQPVRTNQAYLLLLIDQGGSMVPFSPLIATLKESLHLAGFRGRLSTGFFHDVPHPRVYAHPAFLKGRPLEEVLSQQRTGCHVVIVSDAGAARGMWDSQRVQDTRHAVKAIKKVQPNPVWLNPVPAGRWRNTSAQEIAKGIFMTTWSNNGFQRLVNYVRGFDRTPVIRS